MRAEPGPGAVVASQMLLGGRPFSFAALHVAGQGWYVTAATRMGVESPVRWAEIDRRAHGPVFVVNGWWEVPDMSFAQAAARTSHQFDQVADYWRRAGPQT